MRTIVPSIFLLLFSMLACTPATEEKVSNPQPGIQPLPYQPVFVLDQAHNALRQDSATPYLMRPHPSILLDPSDYAMHIPADLNRPEIQEKFDNPGPITAPNVVHVLYKSDVFVALWEKEDGKIRLDAATLGKGQKGSTFSGFEDRERIYMLIGYQGNRTAEEVAAPFVPFYAARVLVDKNPLRFVKPKQQTPRPLHP